MKRSRISFNLLEKPDGDVFWKGLHITALGRNKNKIEDGEYDITPDFQEDFFKQIRLLNLRTMKIN